WSSFSILSNNDNLPKSDLILIEFLYITLLTAIDIVVRVLL
ncbi:MAG: hypothetical protein JWP44_5137, partial [Mucilaginibacter sp.]|nr:hypothetical protein [Mucilaginibacter sp.]